MHLPSNLPFCPWNSKGKIDGKTKVKIRRPERWPHHCQVCSSSKCLSSSSVLRQWKMSNRRRWRKTNLAAGTKRNRQLITVAARSCYITQQYEDRQSEKHEWFPNEHRECSAERNAAAAATRRYNCSCRGHSVESNTTERFAAPCGMTRFVRHHASALLSYVKDQRHDTSLNDLESFWVSRVVLNHNKTVYFIDTDHQHASLWKSPIVLFDVHHLVFAINFPIQLISLILIRFLIRLFVCMSAHDFILTT